MNIRPLKLLPSALIFVSAAALLWVMTHLCIPILSEVTGWEPIIFWFICGGLGVFTPLIITGIMMLRKEGWGFNRKTFMERLRFRPMTRRDWSYSLVALVVIGLLTCGIMVAMQILVPDFNHTPSFMTLEPLSSGRYWLLLLWLPYWVLNIGGEEFFWRGVLLPRQEKAFGRNTWILHGTGWAIFHLAFGWQLLVMLLPLLYIESYVVQKTQNTWTGVFLHGVINGCNDKAAKKAASILSIDKPSSTAISNIGRFDFDCQIGSYTIRDLVCFAPKAPGSYLVLGVATLDDTMQIGFSFDRNIISSAVMEEVKSKMMNLLTSHR